ncbi:heterodisulfide reductase-related iron-sulfur binding cluster [Mogibacterium sp.]
MTNNKKKNKLDKEGQNRLDLSRCIHCHKCQHSCKFLTKYKIDIGDGDRLKELSYHCFLCGECTAVCPVKIDGREVVLNFRREDASSNDGLKKINKKYRGVLLEKRNYKFRNYRHKGQAEAVFFPGCNFLSLYPRTTKYIVDLLLDKAGIGVVYDCCGKPVAELGLTIDEGNMISEMNDRFRRLGIKEIITACPNCFDFLRGKIEAKVVSIYEKFIELGIEGSVRGGTKLFLPCPDRHKRILLEQIEKNFADVPFEQIEGVQCCGLGGCAGVCEPEMKDDLTKEIVLMDEVWVYCATCAGKFARDGQDNVKHIVTEMLGIHEKPDISKSFLNRATMKFK